MLREPEFKNRKRADQEPVRILLLEDDEHFADLLRMQLRRMPWAQSRLEVAGTLAEALAKLSADSFGLVLADLNLPDATGLKAVEALARSGEQLIIVLTGGQEPGLRAGALDAGAYDFLSKDDLSAAALERLVRLASIQANTFRSLRASEARFRGLVELSSDWYWEQDEELRFTRMEGSVSETSGNHPRQAVGKRRWEIAGITPVSCTWDEHRALLEARQPFRDFEYSRIGDDGELRHVSVSGEPVYDARGRFTGYRGLASDITLRTRDDERLRRFRLAMDTSADMILLIDRASLRHVDVNATACRLLGYSREELLAMGPADILALKRAELEQIYDRMIAAPDAVSGMRSRYRCKDGSLLPFESTRRVMRSGDNWIIAVISRDLRDRLASEKALEESEARKAAILDAAMDAIVTMDHTGRIIELNAAAERNFGYARDQAIGKEMAELIIPPEVRAAHRKGLARYVASGEAKILGKRMEVEALRADGSRFDVELAIVRIPGSEPPLFTGTARDITARKHEERLLALEHTVNHCLAAAETAQQGIETVMRAICQAQSWKAGRFYRLDEAADVMRFELGVNVGGGHAGELLARARLLEFARGVGLPGLVWQTGDALWISDTATDPRVARPDLAREMGQHSALLFPVRAEGSIVGVISIASDSIREPDERLRKTMELIGSQIGQFLQRKRAEEDLRRFRLAMDSSADMIVLIDRATMRFTDVNRTVCTLLGYTREEMLTMGPQHILPVSRAQLEASYDALIADPSAPSGMNSHYRCKDGSLLPFESTRQVLPSGSGWLVAAISRDIRERLAAEKSLRDSEARFRSLTGLSSDMYWTQDREYRFTEFAGTGPLGAGRQRILGRYRWNTTYFNMSEADWVAHKATLDARRPFHELELGRINEAGEKVWVSVSGEPAFDEAGAFAGYRGVGKDITARKREEAMRVLEHSVSRCLADADTASGALREVMRAMCESESWESARYFKHDEAAGLMRFEHAWSADDEAAARFNEKSRELSFRAGEGLVGHAWQAGGPIWVADVGGDPRTAHPELAREAGLSGGFAFPVAFEGRTIGVLGFASRAVRQPDERLLQALRVIFSQLAQFLRRKQAEQRQAAHLHYQEKLSRFGQSALAKREPAELVGEVVQTVLEALAAEVVAYLEPGQGEGEVVLRALVGVADGASDARAIALRAGNPILQALDADGRRSAEGAELGFAWAGGMHAALIPVRGESRMRGLLCVCARPESPLSTEALNFIDAMASVLSTGMQRIDSEGRLAYLAQFDPLTGLPNRALLADRFSQMIVQARRRSSPLAVLFIDLDEFKLVNDTLGHAGGDELLKEAAVRLQAAVRSGDTVARISGDEFAVVLADLARPEDAALVAQKIIERLAAPVDVLGQEVFTTASVGIAGFPGDGTDAESLIGAADAAMYRAKQSGRNAFQFFTAEINQRSRARAQMGAELRRALEREEFALVYQPKFHLADRAAHGAEALLRWKHPERGLVSPAEFIPVLEETGLIVPVGEWVLRRACEDLKAWRAAGLDAGPVAVNLSARQFRLPDLDVRLKAVVAAVGVDPSLIELEITESQLMQDPDQAIRVMRSLREAGMRIAIDDFGTGYSSLAYLTRFPVGSLKIDRSFVSNVNDDANAGAIVRTIIEMAHTLGFTVVAEGIETEAQAEYLQRHGCELAQGYLFARPMAAADLAALLAKHCR